MELLKEYLKYTDMYNKLNEINIDTRINIIKDTYGYDRKVTVLQLFLLYIQCCNGIKEEYYKNLLKLYKKEEIEYITKNIIKDSDIEESNMYAYVIYERLYKKGKIIKWNYF